MTEVERALSNVVGVLVTMLGGHVILTKDEIEDAPLVEVTDLFLTDSVDLKTVTPGKSLADLLVGKGDSS